MSRLSLVELRRLGARRLTAIVFVGTLVVVGLMLFGIAQDAKPLPAAQLAAQRVQFEEAHRDWVANGVQQRQDCLDSQTEARKTDATADFGCDSMEPTWASWGKPQTVFHQVMPDVLRGSSYLLAFVGFLVGAGFVAAEFSSGAIGNWLTFEPRRTRVYASKLVAPAAGLVPLSIIVLGVLTGGVWLIAGHYGSTAGTTSQTWADLAGTAGRIVALTSAGGVLGAATGFLLRHTAAALGLAMGYLVLVEGIFSGTLQSVQTWLVKLNFDAWVQHGTSYFINACTSDDSGNYVCSSVSRHLGFGPASAYLAVALAAVVVLAAVLFRRRDVR